MSQPPWDYIAKLVCIGDSGTGKSSLTVRLCEGRFTNTHDVTIGVEFGSRVVPVGPPANVALGINDPSSSLNSTTPNLDEPSTTSTTTTPSANSAVRCSKRSTTASLPDPPRAASSQKHMKLSIWDTAGQDTYKSITRSYFRGASGALLVFDISRRQTFQSVTQWLHDLRQIAEEGIVVVLVGNKTDLAGASLVDGESAANKRAVTQDEAREWCRRNDVMQYVETSAKSGEGVERAFLEVAERILQNIEAGKYRLDDRRSGVKSANAGGNVGRGTRSGGEVVLGVNEVGGMNKEKSGCC